LSYGGLIEKKGENENKNGGRERKYLKRGGQSSCSLISSVRWKRKGGSKLQFLPRRYPENYPQTHPTSHTFSPLHATTHTYNTSVICSGTGTERKSSPSRKYKIFSSFTHPQCRSCPVLCSFFYETQKATGISELIFSVQQKWMVI